MTSFKDVMTGLKTTLESNAALQAYAQAKWSKNIQIMIVFKPDTEVGLDELPLIMMTRPEVKKSSLIGGSREGEHIVRLYFLFREEDRLQAQEILIEMDEKIDDALTAPYPWDIGGALDIKPGDSLNNEGNFHPAYALVMDVSITHSRN